MPNFITLALFVWSESMVKNKNGQNLNFMKIGQKIFFDQKFFSDQLQLLDCEQCAKNEHPITKNGPTIPLSS